MPATAEYERGDAREEVFGAEPPSEAKNANDLAVDNALFELSSDEYWKWLTCLVDEGSTLDQELDELLDQVYDCEPSFYSLSEQRRLRELLGMLHDVRSSVRAYEYDVEELTYVFARSDVMEGAAAENADMTLSQIKDTYNRAYDLCLYKLDRWGDAWITVTNLLISVTILIVTVLFWLEFR